jgi:hypothetical protein
MMTTRLFFLAFLSILMTGCVERAGVRYDSDPHYTKSAPPPHAPAHGYRSKHHQHDLIYDSKLGAYIVVGLSDHYFDNDVYFRYRDGHWEFNINLDNDNGWKHAEDRLVPSKLRSSKSNKSKNKYDNKNNKSKKDKHDNGHRENHDH